MVTDALFTNASKIHRILCNQLTYVQNKFDKLSILFQPADLRGINKKISKILIAISQSPIKIHWLGVLVRIAAKKSPYSLLIEAYSW